MQKRKHIVFSNIPKHVMHKSVGNPTFHSNHWPKIGKTRGHSNPCATMRVMSWREQTETSKQKEINRNENLGSKTRPKNAVFLKNAAGGASKTTVCCATNVALDAFVARWGPHTRCEQLTCSSNDQHAEREEFSFDPLWAKRRVRTRSPVLLRTSAG